MELYFKDLISEEKSLDGLVDDLSRVVQGADDLVKSVEENLSEQSREEINSRLGRLKASYEQFKVRAAASAVATDRLLRRNPYAFAGAGVVLGLLAGMLLWRRK